MTVLSDALRRLGAAAPEPATVPATPAWPREPASPTDIEVGVAWAPIDAAAPAPEGFFANSVATRVVALPPIPAPVVSPDTPATLTADRLPADEADASGEVWLAFDLTESSEQGRESAATLACNRPEGGMNDVAVVVIAASPAERMPPDEFTPTSRPGLFTRGLVLDSPRNTRRQLLVTLDACRRRFLRTVVLLEAEDADLLAILTEQADDVVLLGSARCTPESQLAIAEGLVRSHAPRSRPRVALAA